MKNIQVIDGASNCVYDIFAATEDEFVLIFPDGQDIAFIDEVRSRHPGRAGTKKLGVALGNMWRRPVVKSEAQGIHGILFYELEHKKKFYPTRRDREAINPGGSRLR